MVTKLYQLITGHIKEHTCYWVGILKKRLSVFLKDGEVEIRTGYIVLRRAIKTCTPGHVINKDTTQ